MNSNRRVPGGRPRGVESDAIIKQETSHASIPASKLLTETRFWLNWAWLEELPIFSILCPDCPTMI